MTLEEILAGTGQPSGSGIGVGSGTGISPFGLRYSGEGVKGKGYFGAIPNGRGGYSSELSSEFEHQGKTIEHPLLVPTLNYDQIKHLIGGGTPTPEIYKKSQSFALQRIQQGLSPFAGPQDLRIPAPTPPLEDIVNGARVRNAQPGGLTQPAILGVRG